MCDRKRRVWTLIPRGWWHLVYWFLQAVWSILFVWLFLPDVPCTETARMFCHELFPNQGSSCHKAFNAVMFYRLHTIVLQITLTDTVWYCTRWSCTNWTQFYIAIVFQPLLSVVQYIKNTLVKTCNHMGYSTERNTFRLNDFYFDYVIVAIQPNGWELICTLQPPVITINKWFIVQLSHTLKWVCSRSCWCSWWEVSCFGRLKKDRQCLGGRCFLASVACSQDHGSHYVLL